MANKKEQLLIEIALDIAKAAKGIESLSANLSTLTKTLDNQDATWSKIVTSIERLAQISNVTFDQMVHDIENFMIKGGVAVDTVDRLTQSIWKQKAALDATRATQNPRDAEQAAVPGGGLIPRTAGQLGMYDTGKGVIQFREAIGPLPAQLDKVNSSAKRAGQGFSILRSAMGFLTAMALSNIANAFISMFQKIIDSASQAEQALIKLSIAEKAISQAGIDITPTELTDIAQRVADTYKSVSEIDASKMISNLAVLTKDLHLTADEYENLAMAIPLVAQQAGVSIESATEQVITGLTKSGRGWADLGITVDANIIKQKAVTEGLVASEEAYKNLTAEQKQQVEVLALLQILQDNVAGNAEEQEKYNNTLAGSQTALNAAWEDFAAAIGEFAAPAIIQFLQSATSFLEMMNSALKSVSSSTEELSAMFAGLLASLRELGKYSAAAGPLLGLLFSWEDGTNSFKEGYEKAKKYIEDMKRLNDEPTAQIAPKIEVDDEKIQEAFRDLKLDIEKENRKLEDDKYEAEIDLGIKLGEIDIDYAQEVSDIIRDYNQDIEDEARDYANTIQKINDDTNTSIVDAQTKYREDELSAERDFKNEMLKLREDYLMNLEDALHERDARQVLSLMRQYALDKKQATRDYKADQEERKRAFELELKQIEEERQRKLEEARIEHEQQLAEIELAKQRELEEADLARQREKEAAKRDYENKIAELERHNARRIQEMGIAMQNEYNLTAQQAEALRLMLQGNLEAYTQYMTTMLQMQQDAVNQYNANISGHSGGTSVIGGVHTQMGGFAEGGTVIADKPTSLTFGERGLEMASIIPLNRVGRDVNKLFDGSGNGMRGSSAEGNIAIELFLSPDLESRIVNNTLSETARTMVRVRNRK